MHEAGLDQCLALVMRYSGSAGSEVVCHSIPKVMDVLLWGRGIDAEENVLGQ